MILRKSILVRRRQQEALALFEVIGNKMWNSLLIERVCPCIYEYGSTIIFYTVGHAVI
jgi:hypothetical protein